MTRTRLSRTVAAVTIVLGAGSVVAPAAQAAPECKGATAVIQCWDQRVMECLRNLTLPPGRC